MTKTLVIKYAARKGSYTKILVEEFIKLANQKTQIVELDLAQTPPDLLLYKNLNLIMEWNNGKRKFSNSELSTLSNHHQLIEQLLEADKIVFAFPIYNFTMPAVVKAWVDAIVVSDKTFSFHPEKGFTGLCTSKKALSIIVSGFEYTQSTDVREFATATLKQNLDFIGIKCEHISAFGVDQKRDQLDLILENAKNKIKNTISRWY